VKQKKERKERSSASREGEFLRGKRTKTLPQKGRQVKFKKKWGGRMRSTLYRFGSARKAKKVRKSGLDPEREKKARRKNISLVKRES